MIVAIQTKMRRNFLHTTGLYQIFVAIHASGIQIVPVAESAFCHSREACPRESGERESSFSGSGPLLSQG